MDFDERFYTILWVLDYLKEWSVLELCKSYHISNGYKSLLIFVGQNRFFADFISCNRVSKQTFYVNYNSIYLRFRGAKETAKAIKQIIYKIKFQN